MLFRALPRGQPDAGVRRDLRREGLDHGGLADPGFSGHPHHLAVPLARSRPCCAQVLQDRLTFHEQGRRRRGKGHGRSSRRRGGGDQGHRGYEAIPAPGHGAQEAARRPSIVQGLAQGTNGHAHHGIRDGCLGPDGVEEFLFGHQTLGVGHQIVQHIKGFGRQSDGLSTAPQAGIRRIQRKEAKGPERSGIGHGRSSRSGTTGHKVNPTRPDYGTQDSTMARGSSSRASGPVRPCCALSHPERDALRTAVIAAGAGGDGGDHKGSRALLTVFYRNFTTLLRDLYDNGTCAWYVHSP